MTDERQPLITCYLLEDLPTWERSGVEPLIQELSKMVRVRTVEVRDRHRNCLKGKGGVSWVFSKSWSRALDFLGAAKSTGRVYASVFGIPSEKRALPLLFWKRLHRQLPDRVHLIAHSPLNYRFFREIESFPENKVTFLHLPFSRQLEDEFSGRKLRSGGDGFRIGTFAPFTSTSNLNYFLNVAHYVVKKRPQARFRIFGFGELYRHLSEVVRELSLENHVTIVESLTSDEIDALDILLFTPLRNDHFLPVLTAAAARIPVLASEVPGIGDFIEHGKNGFILPVNETAPMGDLAIHLLDHAIFRRSVSEEFRKSTSEKFSTPALAEAYANLFFRRGKLGGTRQESKSPSKAA